MKLEVGKVIVTGAGSGMGKHFALALKRAGAKVAAVEINDEALGALATEAKAIDAGELRTYVCNVADEDAVVATVKQAGEDLGGLNGLINCAGIFRDGLLVKKDRKTGEVKKLSAAAWQAVIDVDLTGPFLMTREFAAQIIEGDIKESVVINISSVSRAGNMGQSNYSAAKAGLVADTKLWAQELARYGCRVAAIAPGFVRTPILEGMRPEMLEKMLQGVALRRVGEPEELFAGVRFIMECGYFTGRCLDIDGGTFM